MSHHLGEQMYFSAVLELAESVTDMSADSTMNVHNMFDAHSHESIKLTYWR